MFKRNTLFNHQLTALIPRLRRYARVLCYEQQDSEDLLQATLERAMTKQDQWKAGTLLDRWVFTIESSIWKNELRSRSVRQGQGITNTEKLIDINEHHKSEWTILLDQVFEHVMKLPEKQRAAIVLVYVEGMKYHEAAKILDIPQGTLMSRLARGRVALADKMNAPQQSGDNNVVNINDRRKI